MPRPDRQLPEATLSGAEMARLLGITDLRHRSDFEIERFWRSSTERPEAERTHCAADRRRRCCRGTLFVHRGKGAKDRYVPIGELGLFWVQLYVGLVRPLFVLDQDLDLLFLSSVGTPICADWLCRKVRACLRQAGINKRGSCHLLRHSVATLMLEGGADIRYVAEMLGHARLETTQRYTRVSIERLRSVHARCHPASGLDVAMASELCSMLPEGASGLELSVGRKASLRG